MGAFVQSRRFTVNQYDLNSGTVWNPVLGHFRRKLVFLTSEEP